MAARVAGDVLTARARNRALLARQFLLERVRRPALDMVAHLVGLQSQWPQTPYVGLWSRVDGFDPGTLSELYRARAVVRLVVMRSTLHLVTAADALMLRATVQAALERGFRSSDHAKRLGSADLGAITEAAAGHLAAAPRTFEELAALLGADFPQWPGPPMAQVARVHLPLVQVPPRGLWRTSGPARHGLATEWLGTDLTAADPDQMVLRYLAAYGPASVRDAQAWSGLTRLGEVFERLRPRLCALRDESGRELFDLPDAPRPDPQTPAPVRFLPEFDGVLLAHADRSHVLAPADQPRVFTINGIVRGTVLVDGMVAATWSVDAGTLTVTPLRRLSTKDILAEGRRLFAFVEPDAAVDVVVGPVAQAGGSGL